MTSSQDTKLRSILYDAPKEGQPNLFEHLVHILDSVDSCRDPSGSIKDFENISHFIKTNNFVYKNPKPAEELAIKKEIDEFGVKKFTQKKMQFIQVFKIDNHKEQCSFSADSQIQNIVQDNQDWNLAGLGFSEEESFILQQSINRLAKNMNMKKLKFWGKITGSQKDYFVAYGLPRSFIRDKCPDNWELEGEGVNAIAFFVTNDLLEEWVQLPVIGPEHIQVARQIIHQFTGDLNAKVTTLVPFSGKEKHLLKAQLVRIHSNAEIVPSGVFRPNEENEKIIEADPEAELPDKETMSGIDGWVHFNPEILKMGRTTYYIPSNLDEEAKDELLAKYEEKDPIGDRLKSCSDDNPDDLPHLKYIIRAYGDSQQFNLVAPEEGVAGYDVVAIRNPIWPGWVTIYNPRRKQWSSLYLGNGVKDRQPFIPSKIADFMKEPKDLSEHAEPNHFEKPKPEGDDQDPDASDAQDDE